MWSALHLVIGHAVRIVLASVEVGPYTMTGRGLMAPYKEGRRARLHARRMPTPVDKRICDIISAMPRELALRLDEGEAHHYRAHDLMPT